MMMLKSTISALWYLSPTCFSVILSAVLGTPMRFHVYFFHDIPRVKRLLIQYLVCRKFSPVRYFENFPREHDPILLICLLPHCNQTWNRFVFANSRLMVQSIEFTKGTIFYSALAALSSLRDLSKATSILSDPSKVPEQALRASTARDPTDLATMMAPPGATGETRDNGALGGFSWNS